MFQSVESARRKASWCLEALRPSPPRVAVRAWLKRWLAQPVVIAIGLGAALSGCDPMGVHFEPREPARVYRATQLRGAPPARDSLRVMTWNIKFAGGRVDFFFEGHGDRVHLSPEEVQRHLEGLAAKIRQVDPDLLVLQEVDVRCKRTGELDMVQWLLDHTELDHGVYASQWRVAYVPSRGIGRVDSGTAILSRWPLTEPTRIALPLIGEQSALVRYFYLRRNLLKARLRPWGKDLWVLGGHLSAFAQDGTKERQVRALEKELEAIDRAGQRFLFGGDLNALPPGTVQVKDFPDAAYDDEDFDAGDFSSERELLSRLYARYRSAIPLDEYQKDNRPYFTHTTRGDGFWNRKLDYLFTNGSFVPGSGLTHQDEASGGVATMPLSDHAPLVAELAL